MSQIDWVKIYAEMDKRIVVKSSNCRTGSKSESDRKRETSRGKLPE